jgi:hypothetical protein
VTADDDSIFQVNLNFKTRNWTFNETFHLKVERLESASKKGTAILQSNIEKIVDFVGFWEFQVD